MELGCFNRPWTGCELERAFQGMAKAGFRYCGLLRHERKEILSAASAPADVAALLEQIRRHGLQLRCNLVRVPLDVPAEVSIECLRAEIDAARDAGVPHLLTTGASDPTRYDLFVSVLQAARPYAAGNGVTLGVKPHGGISATNEDCVALARRVGTDGFGIWYDPGNILFYTGTDPEADLSALAPYVVGMCVKDCRGGERGTVSITPGDGEVRFERIFPVLRDVGFRGPVLVECLGGETPEQVDAEARRAHDALLSWIGG